MNDLYKEVIAGFKQVAKPAKSLPVDDVFDKLPTDFLEFYNYSDGGEGFVGEGYLIVWPADKLVDYNYQYEVHINAPGIFIFGSNGGGEAFGFDMSSESNPIIQIPFIGMDLKYSRVVAKNFADLLSRMKSCDENIY